LNNAASSTYGFFADACARNCDISVELSTTPAGKVTRTSVPGIVRMLRLPVCSSRAGRSAENRFVRPKFDINSLTEITLIHLPAEIIWKSALDLAMPIWKQVYHWQVIVGESWFFCSVNAQSG